MAGKIDKNGSAHFSNDGSETSVPAGDVNLGAIMAPKQRPTNPQHQFTLTGSQFLSVNLFLLSIISKEIYVIMENYVSAHIISVS